MATHSIPRNVKGEGRILFIFTAKSLIFSAVGLGVGLLINAMFSFIVKSFYVKLAIDILFAGIGYAIATLKVPDSPRFEITKKAGGEKIDEVILRAIKFKLQKKRIYVYTKEEKNYE